MIEINLLPGAQRKSRRSGRSFAPAALSGLGAQLKDKYLIMGTAGLAIGLAAIAGMYMHQAGQEKALDARESAAAADSARFYAVLHARTRAETRRDSVYQQLAIIKSIDDTRYSWSHILQAINLSVPQYTWLTEVSQTSAVTSGAGYYGDTTAAGRARTDSLMKAPPKDGNKDALARAKRAHADSLFNGAATTTSFRITGQTVDLQALTLFMKNLEASPFIKNVQLTRSDLVSADSKEVTEFQLEAQSEVPPRLMIQTVPIALAVR